jgi:hypothetical protein
VLIAVLFYYGAAFLNRPATIKSDEIVDVGASGIITLNGKKLEQSNPEPLQAKPHQTITFASRPIEIDRPANAAVLTWKQSAAKGINLEVRTKNNNRWTGWKPLEASEPGKDNYDYTDSNASSIVLADTIDSFEFRATLKGDETASAKIDFSKSTLETIDSKKPKSIAMIESTVDSLASSTASAQSAQPRIISRAEWGSPEPNHSSWPAEYASVRRAIIHHTATTETSDSYADVRAIWHYHARSLGWGDIGYNYIVDSKGNIFQGRYFDHNHARKTNTDVIGGHAYGSNSGSTGISVIGNYQYQDPSPAAINSVSQIIGYKLAPYNLNPHTPGVVIGHRDVYATSCPGNNLVARYDTIKHLSASYAAQYASLEPMESPRWMNISGATVRKYDLKTLDPVDGALPTGAHLRFVDKRYINGEWYLRTTYDKDNSLLKGVKLSDISDIQPERLASTELLQLRRNSSKVSPTHGTQHAIYSQHQAFTFDSKITVNNHAYYRSSFDTENNIDAYIDADLLKDPELVPFETPRYVFASSQTLPLTATSTKNPPQLTPAAHDFFTHKITVNSTTFYQSKQNNIAGNNLITSATGARDVQVTPFEKPIPVALLRPAQKYHLPTASIQPGYFDPRDYDVILTYGSVELGGKVFYQTDYDHTHGILAGFAKEDLVEVVFEPLANPEEKMISKDSKKRTISGLIETDDVLPAQSRLTFTSKITIDGKEYYRTQWDTERSLNKVISADVLQ